MGELSRSDIDAEVNRELSQLTHRPTKDLRVKYRELYRRVPPSTFGRDLLRRSIAYRVQELAYGGLSIDVRQELEQLVTKYSKNASKKSEPGRRIKAGSVLVRDWKGKSCRVTVELNGFSYEGEAFSSLSEIARKITGTRWNGPRFFGLKKPSIASSSKSLARGGDL